METKVCPTCGTVNDSSEMMCTRCMADISAVIPGSANDKKAEDKIYLWHGTEKIEIKNGDIIGRDNKWNNYLENYKTVSRKHAMFSYQNEKWLVEDCGSTNGTYVNDKDIRGNGKTELKKGDKIGMSKSFIVEVKGAENE